MNSLKVIDERTVLNKNFRVYGDFNNPLFLAKDVAEWIEHSNSREMLKSIDDDEKLMSVILTSGQRREVQMLTEDGLYEVLMQSRKPIAKNFKKEVKKILKDIRKHGLYAKDELLDNPELLIQLATTLKEERENNRKLQNQIEEDKPKVLFADSVSASKTSILIGELAKIIKGNGIDMGQNRLFSWLRDNGYLVKRKGSDYNMPTQKSMNLKLFEIKETNIQHSDGHISITKTTKVTGKGQQYFINMFLSKTA